MQIFADSSDVIVNLKAVGSSSHFRPRSTSRAKARASLPATSRPGERLDKNHRLYRTLHHCLTDAQRQSYDQSQKNGISRYTKALTKASATEVLLHSRVTFLAGCYANCLRDSHQLKMNQSEHISIQTRRERIHSISTEQCSRQRDTSKECRDI